MHRAGSPSFRHRKGLPGGRRARLSTELQRFAPAGVGSLHSEDMRPEADDLRPPLSLPRPRRAALLLCLLLALLGVSGSASPLPPVAAASSSPPPQSEWQSPTATGSPDVVRPYSAPPAPWAAGHRGVDLGLGGGEQIRAPADGTVSFSGTVVDRDVLSINHGSGYVSSFEPVEPELEVGDPVTAGQTVASLGTYDDGSAHCPNQPCLHWGVRHHGEYINPLLLLGDLEPSVLLPLERSK